MKLFIWLLALSLISIFIPHKDRKYNLSWWSRGLFTITILYAFFGGFYFLLKYFAVI
jgi:hypothetical protein